MKKKPQVGAFPNAYLEQSQRSSHTGAPQSQPSSANAGVAKTVNNATKHNNFLNFIVIPPVQ